MHDIHAHIARRAATLAAALLATLGAHAAALGGVTITRAAPLLWAMLLVVAAMAGGRGSFAPRGYLRTVGAMMALQTGLHAVMVAAPWLVGLGANHHESALIDARSLLVHALAALVIAWLLCGADRALAAAVAALRALARSEDRPTSVRPTLALADLCVPGRGRPARAPRTSRGPPRAPMPAAMLLRSR